ncbi:hypothetical protein [Halorarius halobius]|uniref:hypothetical protein n=1 Tax=Halorarius halobius TaxID=2962671 RepID=UPI0020CE625F|nr:hypothetical protein [Halorarius halobius]
MDRTTNTVFNALLNFAVGYFAGSVLKDRSTGLKAGLALGALGGVVAYAMGGRMDDEDDTFFGIDRVETRDPET